MLYKSVLMLYISSFVALVKRIKLSACSNKYTE
jgi:hypothetical protein